MNPRIEKEEVQMRNIIRILHERISDLNKKFRDICDPLPPSKPEYADNLQQESGSDQYVQIGNTISHVDGSQIRDDEISYLMKVSEEDAEEYYRNSPNPKFHRTDREQELSFEFAEKYSSEALLAEEAIHEKVQNAARAYKKCSKTARIEDIRKGIILIDDAINAYNNWKNFCYSHGEGGKIYFDDFWELCHNSNSPCFSYISGCLEEKNLLLERMHKIESRTACKK